jgi:hypothetical protein
MFLNFERVLSINQNRNFLRSIKSRNFLFYDKSTPSQKPKHAIYDHSAEGGVSRDQKNDTPTRQR